MKGMIYRAAVRLREYGERKRSRAMIVVGLRLRDWIAGR